MHNQVLANQWANKPLSQITQSDLTKGHHTMGNTDISQQVQDFLFDNIHTSCEHINPTDMPFQSSPNLCWLHPDQGLFCLNCLTIHGQLDHHKLDLQTRRCYACQQPLSKAHPLTREDSDPWVTFTRRTIPLAINDDHEVTIQRVSDNPSSLTTIRYQGRTRQSPQTVETSVRRILPC